MQPLLLTLAQRSAHMHRYTLSFPFPFLLVLDQIWSWGLALAHIPSLFFFCTAHFSWREKLETLQSGSYKQHQSHSLAQPQTFHTCCSRNNKMPFCWCFFGLHFVFISLKMWVPSSCSSDRHLSLLQTAQEGWVCSWKAGWTCGLACLGLIVTKPLCKTGFVLTIASLGFLAENLLRAL